MSDISVERHPRRVSVPMKVVNRIFSLPLVPDEISINVRFRNMVGYKPNLLQPRSFNEKLNWLKLHDRNPEYTRLVDKLTVKEWVEERLGPGHTPRTLAVWSSPSEIDIAELPNAFVMKTNHDSADVLVCQDKNSFNIAKAKRVFRKKMHRNHYYAGREWPYRNVQPKVFAEEFMRNDHWDFEECRLYPDENGVSIVNERLEELVASAPGATWRCRSGLIELECGSDAATLAETLREKAGTASPDVAASAAAVLAVSPAGLPVLRAKSAHPKASNAIYWVQLPPQTGGGYLLIEPDGHSRLLVPNEQPESLQDYKLMCYNGQVRQIHVTSDRGPDGVNVDYFTPDWTHLPFTRHYPCAEEPPKRPRRLDEMIEIAEKLSTGFPFVRVDLYDLEGYPIFVGEMTLYPGAGFTEFDPEEWDYKLGADIDLSLAYEKRK